jgi:hypothetical protein
MVTCPPACNTPETGAGPQAELHCCTVNVSVIGDIVQEPSMGASARATPAEDAEPRRAANTAERTAGMLGRDLRALT